MSEPRDTSVERVKDDAIDRGQAWLRRCLASERSGYRWVLIRDLVAVGVTLRAQLVEKDAEIAELKHRLYHSQKDTEGARGDRNRFQQERNEAREQVTALQAENEKLKAYVQRIANVTWLNYRNATCKAIYDFCRDELRVIVDPRFEAYTDEGDS